MSRYLFNAIVVLLLLSVCVASAADVDLTLYNTAALLDSDASTPLAGTSSGGDLVQLILAGANGVPDTPTANGLPGGDDTMLAASNNPTHVNAGTLDTDTGIFSQAGMLFDDSLVGDDVFIRFWNNGAAHTATHYGDSEVTTLPAADGFGLADLDMVPTTGDARTTDTAFSATETLEVPTLSEWSMMLLAAIFMGWGAMHVANRQPAFCRASDRRR